MPIVSFECRACGSGLEVDEELAGRLVSCGHCQAEQPAPGPAPDSIPVVRPSLFPRDPDGTPEIEPPRERRGLSPVGRVALLVAAVFGLFAAGGVAFTLANPGGWQTLRPEGGGFVVEMPGRIRSNPEIRSMDAFGQNWTLTTYTSVRRAPGRVETAEVSYVDLPAAPDENGVGPMLTVFANQIAQEPGRQLIRKGDVSLDGRPGVVVYVELQNKHRAIYQLTLRDRRLFILSLTGPRFTPEHAQVIRFFKSFHVVGD